MIFFRRGVLSEALSVLKNGEKSKSFTVKYHVLDYTHTVNNLYLTNSQEGFVNLCITRISKSCTVNSKWNRKVPAGFRI